VAVHEQPVGLRGEQRGHDLGGPLQRDPVREAGVLGQLVDRPGVLGERAAAGALQQLGGLRVGRGRPQRRGQRVLAGDGRRARPDVLGQRRGTVGGRGPVGGGGVVRRGVQGRLQHGDLAAEAEVERLHRDPGRRGDPAHRGLEVAVADEQRGGRGDDPGSGGAGPLRLGSSTRPHHWTSPRLE
jgi:hypothetical protein